MFLSRTADTATEIREITENKIAFGKKEDLRQLPIEILQRGRYQPRREMAAEALQELADSIRSHGVLQPIIVRNIEKDNYEIIAGERRWRAAQLAGLTEIPVIIKNISDQATLAIALIENIQRENLNAVEEAIALQRLLDEFGMTHQQVAEAVGKSRTTVTNLLRLLNLVPEVKTLLEQKKIEMGHARALLALDSIKQIDAAQTIIRQNLSVRETERLVQSYQHPKTKIKAGFKIADPDISGLQKDISDKLGAKVLLQHNKHGKGKMVIHYNNLDQLDGILSRIQ
jgi:ParB family transcriptional regulator, chromosome partitioning protein